LPFVAEQNGGAKRLMRGVLQKLRVMSLEHGMSTVLWPEAIHTASHFHISVPSMWQKNIQIELVFGERPNAENLRVLRCQGKIHLRKVDRDKFAPVGEECTMTGYVLRYQNLKSDSGAR
jgi:hypothetical protein